MARRPTNSGNRPQKARVQKRKLQNVASGDKSRPNLARHRSAHIQLPQNLTTQGLSLDDAILAFAASEDKAEAEKVNRARLAGWQAAQKKIIEGFKSGDLEIVKPNDDGSISFEKAMPFDPVIRDILNWHGNLKYPEAQRIISRGLLDALRKGDAIAYGRVNSAIQRTEIPVREWLNEWFFIEKRNRAIRKTPEMRVDNVLILRAIDVLLDTGSNNQGGRPSEIEEDFNSWEAQAVIGKRRPLLNITDAFNDFIEYVNDIYDDKARAWQIDTFAKHIKNRRPAIHAALTAAKDR